MNLERVMGVIRPFLMTESGSNIVKIEYGLDGYLTYCKKIAVQLPESLLIESLNIMEALEVEFPDRSFFVVADSSFNK